MSRGPVAVVRLAAALGLVSGVLGATQAGAATSYELIPSTVVMQDQLAPHVSSNGRYVVFEGDGAQATTVRQIWIYDRVTKVNELVSVSSQGTPGDLASSDPAVSADGRYVAFSTAADNLVAGDTNRVADVFVRDRKAHRTYRVDVSITGKQLDGHGPGLTPSISADGQIVTFAGDGAVFTDAARRPTTCNGQNDYGLYATRWQKRHSVSLVSASPRGAFAGFASTGGNGVSNQISGNGRYVAFATPSEGTCNNVRFSSDPQDQAGSGRGAYVRDLATGTTHLLVAQTPVGVTAANAAHAVDDQLQPTRVGLDDSGLRAIVDVTYVGGPDYDQQRVMVVDWKTHHLTILSTGVGPARDWDASLSGDGKYAAVLSGSTKVAPGSMFDGFAPPSVWRISVATGVAQRLDACATADAACVASEAFSQAAISPASLSRDGAVAVFVTPLSLRADDPDRDATKVAQKRSPLDSNNVYAATSL
jgi:Tol biopolymer transport system component